MLLAIALHMLVAVIVLLIARRAGRWVFAIAAAVPAVTFAWVMSGSAATLAGDARVETLSWAPKIGLESVLRLDVLSFVMIILVSGVGAVVFAFYAAYAKPGERGVGRTAALLSVFAGAMLGLVLADDIFTLYVFWELTTVCSFLLVGGDGVSRAARRSAVQALLVTAIGGLAMLGGLVLLAEASGTYRISEIVANPPSGAAVNVALVLLLVGVVTKSAQVPFHPWLPGAMVAPTPVSAYLHAAAMVKAGVYLLARFAPGFGDVPAWWVPAVVLGSLTMLIGGYRALRETDLKTLLAYGTVSQLGFLTVLMGAGTRAAALAGITLLLAHGLFKSALFLVVGVIDRQTGTRDIRHLSGVGRQSPALAVFAVLALASMAGLPPLLGFVGKETAFEAFTYGGTDTFVLVAIALGSVLTVAYSIRFVWGAFATKTDLPDTAVSTPGIGLLGPVALPALAGLVFGVATPLASTVVDGYPAAMPFGPEASDLALWHGIGVPLGLSVLALVGGYLVYRYPASWQWLCGRLPSALNAQRGYERAVTGLDDVAHKVTGRLQVGSLPAYLGVILVAVFVVAGVGMISDTPLPAEWRWFDNPLQVPLALLVLAGAWAAVFAHRRITAVLFASVVGYGIAALFIVDGGPDLALAQFLVESLTLVVFVFVLRRFPAHFSNLKSIRSFRFGKLAVAATAGILVSLAGVLYSGARTESPTASQEYAERAVSEAGASNVVNAIIVDFRAFDTVGEITVLAVAAAGAASLILAAQRSARRPTESDEDSKASKRKEASR
ncbi:multicomponent Na+:H+ antiporter subunit A [Tamaricihabitans halophyticus]|uniref:Multicomponent Na+:H+ antiporter subunit A n=1 Tax=Tamaricihabitans halophyticus TaxID=1262583 RepID=A0A4R2R6T1_9PSEU|nr:hydrogen gas-evolving membrane-bound hydrogenase subunit E [Tamaricihabitans halophyticus]TCP55341.1 multicomponent Na+:H+ antiporter subunit A [Tamaricihabitans halophyticus]